MPEVAQSVLGRSWVHCVLLGIAIETTGMVSLALGARGLGRILAAWPASLVFYVLPKSSIEFLQDVGVALVGFVSGACFWMVVACVAEYLWRRFHARI